MYWKIERFWAMFDEKIEQIPAKDKQLRRNNDSVGLKIYGRGKTLWRPPKIFKLFLSKNRMMTIPVARKNNVLKKT